MDYFDKEYCIEVTGDYACFTQPAFKAERFSYPVPTPSAMRNILQSIFWVKGATEWEITKIEVLKPIQFEVIKMNEVGGIRNLSGSKLTKRELQAPAGKVITKKVKLPAPIYIDNNRLQRVSSVLKDVAYRIYAKLVFIPIRERSPRDQEITKAKLAQKGTKDENPGKYYAEFERRIKSGGCFQQPYLGIREYSCSFELVEHPKPMGIPQDQDLGIMLYDLDFENNPTNPTPLFFHARMKQGVIHVPNIKSKEILR